MDTAEDACCDPHMYKAVKHSQDCFVRMGQSQGLVRTDARKNVFFRAQNGKGQFSMKFPFSMKLPFYRMILSKIKDTTT